MNIVEALNNLRRTGITDPEHDCKASDVAKAVSRLLAEVVLIDDSECSTLAHWEEKILKETCSTIFGGEHSWIHDNCGYWGHQYCNRCDEPKYPGLMRLSVRKAIEQVGRITEEQYLEQISEATNA